MAEKYPGLFITKYLLRGKEYTTLLDRGDTLPFGSVISRLDDITHVGVIDTVFLAVESTETELSSWGIIFPDVRRN